MSSEEDKRSYGAILPWYYLEREPDNPDVQAVVKAKLKRLEELRATNEAQTLILSFTGMTNPPADELPRFLEASSYARSFLHSIPPYYPEDLPHDSEAATFLNRARQDIFIALACPRPQPLHDTEPGYYGNSEYHGFAKTNKPHVYYHVLDCDAGNEAGDGVDFFTVNIDEETIRALAKEAGAVIEEAKDTDEEVQRAIPDEPSLRHPLVRKLFERIRHKE